MLMKAKFALQNRIHLYPMNSIHNDDEIEKPHEMSNNLSNNLTENIKYKKKLEIQRRILKRIIESDLEPDMLKSFESEK